MNENVTITGGHIKDDMFCHYSYSKEVAKGITDKATIKSQRPIHDDMKAAFRKLNPHLAVICEEVHNLEIGDIDKMPVRPENMPLDEWEKSLEGIDKKLYAFVVSGIQYDGSGENEGVILIGKKTLSTGDSVQLTTPKIVWEASSYFFINELRVAARDLADEIMLYMDGKQAPRAIQTEMEFPVEEGEEDEDIKPKKRGRRGSKENPVNID